MTIPDATLDEIRSALRLNMASLAEHLCGEPNRSRSNWRELRFGRKGSLSVVIRGSKQGLWRNFEVDAGGDAIDLIKHTLQYGFFEAVTFAASFLGISLDGVTVPPSLPERRKAAESRPEAQIDDPDRSSKIQAARAIWSASAPIEGTVAERYLIEVRRIPPPSRGWPGSVLRFHPPTNSLVVAATQFNGTVQAIQRVRLGADARKVDDGWPAKPSRGPQDGAMVRFPGPTDGPLLVAEGPETGMTAWVAGGHETWVALGSMSKLSLPRDRRIIICADDDPRHPRDGKPANAQKQLKIAMAHWRGEGLDVTLLYPWPTRREDNGDLNDVIQREGIAAVRARIDLALNPPTATPLGLPLMEAREKLDAAVGEFFGRALDIALPKSTPPKNDEESKPQNYAQRDWGGNYVAVPPAAPPPPPAVAIRVDVGVGKSEAARRHAVELVTKLRQEGCNKVVVIAVPTHNLGEEQAAKIEPLASSAGLSVAVWRGRRAPDPSDPDYNDPEVGKGDKATMCRDLDAVSAAEEIMADVQSSICKRKKSKPDDKDDKEEYYYCPYFDECAYQRQLSATADIWIVPHSLIFTATPPNIGVVSALVIDERFYSAGLKEEIQFPLDLLNTRHPAKNQQNTDRLLFLEQHAEVALRRHPDGSLERHHFSLSGLTDDSARDAIMIEWQRKQEETKLRPGMSQAERVAVVEAEKVNRHVGQRVGFWSALADLLRPDGPAASGWLSLDRGKKGERQIVLNGRREIPVGWQVPTLLLDATMRLETVRPFFPGVVMAEDIVVQAPHQHVVQVYDRAYTKSALVAQERNWSTEAKRRRHNLKELRDRIILEARRVSPGRVLVVAQMAIETALLACGPLPDGVETAHHNDVAGRDGWRDVALLIVIGRTMPPVAEVARMAGALTGVKAGDCGNWYQRSDATRVVAGQVELTDADRHVDRLAEALRWQVCEGELIQIIGRGRGVSRIAENPLDVLICCDVPLPLPVDEVVPAAELALSASDKMLLEAGIALENAAHAFKAFPNLWPSLAAAKKAAERGTLATFPYKRSLLGECRQLLQEVTYQVATQGQSKSIAWVDTTFLANPASWLAARLGPLAFFRVEWASEIAVPYSASDSTPDSTGWTGVPRQLVGLDCEPGLVTITPPDPAPLVGETSSMGGDADKRPQVGRPETPEPWPPAESTVTTLTAAPPWPDDFVGAPLVSHPAPLVTLDPLDIVEARRRLKALDLRLRHARPPRLWGDEFDAIKEQNWRERMAAIRAERERDHEPNIWLRA